MRCSESLYWTKKALLNAQQRIVDEGGENPSQERIDLINEIDKHVWWLGYIEDDVIWLEQEGYLKEVI